MLMSVIIPVYNVEPYLSECLESVLSQSFDDMEILCVEDCSTDGSLAILEKYAERDPRIRVIRNERNGGLSYARNRAMEQAKGKYVFFLDSDDLLPPDALSQLAAFAEERPSDIIAYEVEVRDETEGRVAGNNFSGKYIARGFEHGSGPEFFVWTMDEGIGHSPVWMYLWNRQFLDRHHLHFHEGAIHEDMSFTPIGYLLARSVTLWRHVCYIYRRRPQSITSSPNYLKSWEGYRAAYLDVASFLAHRRNMFSSNVQAHIERMLESLRREAWKFAQKAWETESDASVLANPILTLEYDWITQRNNRFLSGGLREKQKELLQAWTELIIYGAGAIGSELMRSFEEAGIRNYRLAVTKKRAQAQGLERMAAELSDLHALRDTSLVIVATGQRLHDTMAEEARRQGFAHVVWYQELFTGDAAGAMASSDGSVTATWRKTEKSMLLYFKGGFGDNISHKRVVDALVAADPGVCIDIDCAEGKAFLDFLYKETPQVHQIRQASFDHYMRESKHYAAALQMQIAVSVHVDVCRDPSPFSAGLANILRSLKREGEREQQTWVSEIGYMTYARCAYQQMNCYDRLSYGGVVPYPYPHVLIPCDASSEAEVCRRLPGDYVTVNYGNGTTDDKTLAAKSWPLASFERLIALLHEAYPHLRVVQLGAKTAQHLAGADDYVLGQSFEAVTSLLRHARLHIDIEGGLVHLASNLGTKCIVLFGPTPVWYYGYRENINIRAGSCHDCYGLCHDCTRCARDMAKPECMYSITPEMVMDAVRNYFETIYGQPK